MKTCTKCKKKKPEVEFSWQRGKRRARCKRCEIDAQTERYRKDPTAHLAKTYRIRERNRQFMWNYYSEHPCVDCGESDPVVLEPDHLDPKFKLSGVSQLVHNTRSLAVIKAELEKCEIVCANCHRRRTAVSQQWFNPECPQPIVD